MLPNLLAWGNRVGIERLGLSSPGPVNATPLVAWETKTRPVFNAMNLARIRIPRPRGSLIEQGAR